MERSSAHRFVSHMLLSSFVASTSVLAASATAGPQTSDAYHADDHSHAAHPGQLALPETTACLDAALARGQSANAYSGIAAAVVLDGRVVYRRGFGTVSPTSTQPVLPSTRFRFGSAVKPMTATALLSLAQEGRVRLHEPINALLPGIELPGAPGWSERLTAHVLLSHQGGIEDSGEIHGPSDDGALAAAFYDPAFLQTTRLMVAPGTFYNYSNQNFSLAGLVAETAAGKPYRYVMQQRVFKPLGMKRTTFLASDVLADDNFAYGVVNSTIVAPDDYDHSIMRPAGFAWSTADDLAKYALFVIHGRPHVLSPRMWRAMRTQQVDTLEGFDYAGYGYGFRVESAASLLDDNRQVRFYDGVKVVSHGGAIEGYRAFMLTLPAQRFGYVALVNGDVASPLVNLAPACFHFAAAETISKRLPPPSAFPDPGIQRDRFIDYVGNYSDRINLAGPAIVTLTPSGDLHAQFPDLDAIDFGYNPILLPLRRDNFALRTEGGNFLLTGIRGTGNEIEHLRMRLTVLSRTPSEPATLRSTAAIDPQALERAVRAAAREERETLSDLPR